MNYFIAVKAGDQYERIAYIEKTAILLAEKIGSTTSSVRSAFSKGITVRGYKIEKVEINYDEAEDICG